MPFYLRFRFGPFRYSERVGRTAAQKRAARKRREGRQDRRRYANGTDTGVGYVTGVAPGRLVITEMCGVQGDPAELLRRGVISRLPQQYVFKGNASFAPGEKVWFSYRRRDRKVMSVNRPTW